MSESFIGSGSAEESKTWSDLQLRVDLIDNKLRRLLTMRFNGWSLFEWFARYRA
jgi:hypothetical protein